MDSNDPTVARLQRDTQRSMEAVLDMVRYRQMIVVETREQIARGIVAYHNDPKSCHKDYRHCECEVYLAIAKGEPNQVTKDAIEEARKMNGEKLGCEK